MPPTRSRGGDRWPADRRTRSTTIAACARKSPYARLVSELARLQFWWEEAKLRPGVTPGDATAIPATSEGPHRKLTLRLDAELAKWFRAMGHGYQARMNYALRCWMLSVVTREVDPREAWRRG